MEKKKCYHLKYECLIRRCVIAMSLCLVALSALAQSEEEPSHLENELKWAVGGVFMMMAPEVDHHYFDKNVERYIPQTPTVWLGSARITDDVMGGHQSPFHLRSGFPKKVAGGLTLLQLSRNLYRGMAGYSVGLQFEGATYDLMLDHVAKGVGDRVDFIPAEAELRSNELSVYSFRIPLMVGVQTPRRWLSLQTGLGLWAGGNEYEYQVKRHKRSEYHNLHTYHVGAQWLLAAGIGPVSVCYSQHLTPLFRLTDGTKAYPSSLTFGLDIWYLMCRLTHSKK